MARPKNKNQNEVKSRKTSIRTSPDQDRVIEKHHGSVQKLIDDVTAHLLMLESKRKK